MKFASLPSILSVQRCLILSDAAMENVVDGVVKGPVAVIRHGVLGTQNVAGKDKDIKNPQRTESAKTDPDATGMQVSFSMSTILLKNALFACNDQNFRKSIDDFVERFADSGELREVCNRYARNILNGRWLWRNRILGQKITVSVKCGEEREIVQDATRRPSDTFGDYTEQEKELGGLLFKSLTEVPLKFKVSAMIDFGMKGSFEVFPSQNYVDNKPEGFARSLYKRNMINRDDLIRLMRDENPDTFMKDIIYMGDAYIRDQKIGNAIRTIDTWYEGGDDARPIPVEPKGANIETNEVKRENNSLFGLLLDLDSLTPGVDRPNPDAMFVLANLVRGFLAGEKNEKSESSGKAGRRKERKPNQPDLLEENA
ncbi:type I-F CRISPR-associated protein Csy3 [Pelomicrobium methylotrophicum]|nr:type I-F CRISPR-associated protein Csy3 [Pelomicrobium methylotrophicum]